MLKLFLWLKYMHRLRIILLSVAAVAMSVSLLVVVASLFTGFIDTFERSAVDMIGDVIVTAPPGVKIEDYPAFIERLEQTSIVQAATATLNAAGLLNVEAGNVVPVSIWGIEPAGRTRVTGFKKTLLRQGQALGEPSFEVPGQPGVPGGFVGIGVVAKADEQTDEYDQQAILKEKVGQRMVATTGTFEVTEGEARIPKRRTIPFYVADVVFIGVHEFDSAFVFLPIEALQKALYPAAERSLATSINIKLKPGVDLDSAVAQIRGLWGMFAEQELGWSSYLIAVTEIETARGMQSPYVAAIRQQMGVLLLIFGVISFSVVVLVFCIFYMMVKVKQRDIAIIKSCGAASTSVMWLFLGFGASIGVAGAGFGALLGYIITRNINIIEEWIRIAFGLKLWQSSVYMFSTIPNVVDWATALPIVGLAIVAAALGALVPALVAARTRPVAVLRYE